MFIDKEFEGEARERSLVMADLWMEANLYEDSPFPRCVLMILIWPYIINNYYREKPAAFDLLFWNADPVNLPGPMFAEYFMRYTHLENRIAKKTAVFFVILIDMALG
ncbi:MAG: hypothetical protein ACNYPH_00695 [Gammaproteobacteria bacterium WSBS_2016_MAG_OTU1]